MTDSDWPQLELLVASEHYDLVEAALYEIGALAITVIEDDTAPAEGMKIFEHQPNAEPILWQHLKVQALFDRALGPDELRAATSLALDALPVTWSLQSIADQDWHTAWMERYEPLAFGDRLWVCPSWKPVPAACEVALRLDPGLAFGTGTHPTTAMCLRWLDAHDCTGKYVVDYGCGSGILIIAALLLGARHGLALDIDAQALQSCADNAHLNAIDMAQLEIFAADALPSPAPRAEIVIANILAGPLVNCAEHILSLLKPGGELLLSGILAPQSESVMEYYKAHIDFEAPVHDQEWVLLYGRKK